MPFIFENTRRVVVKIGTRLLSSGTTEVDVGRLGQIAEQIAAWSRRGIEVVVVSSGAVGLGMARLGISKRPTELAQLQACAAIGQASLIQRWRDAFAPHDLDVAQILLTHDDVRGRRQRHLAVRDTIERLLSLGIIPVINENDTVSVDEIRFGDNDVLSALVASFIKAELLVILSTAPGLQDRRGDGCVIPVVEEIDDSIRALAGGSEHPTSTGGMITKLEAASIATQSGCAVFIANGHDPVVLLHLVRGVAEGTLFLPRSRTLGARKRWIAFFQRSAGCITVDAGARLAVQENNKSLLPKGITRVDGDFAEGAIVDIAGPDGQVFARGQTDFSSEALGRIAGLATREVKEQYPHSRRTEAVHRDSLVVLS